MTDTRLHVFEGVGVELEYMIVDAGHLAVHPIADQLIEHVGGSIVAEFERGAFAWSNELVLHVIEFKTNGPARALTGLAAGFQHEVDTANAALASFEARLLPTGMHPTMNPDRELHLWPHEYNAVYHAFDRIFDCHGHGWANLQSLHLNLPFSGDREFGKLHEAIRILLPIMPGLAASTPVMDGQLGPHLDMRLAMYRSNAHQIPTVTGLVVPDSVASEEEYQERILRPLYRDIAPHDPEGILQFEWLNARGAIARFDRGTIEIRVLDMQECPAADLAVAAMIIAVLRWMVEGDSDWLASAKSMSTAALAHILTDTTSQGCLTPIENTAYLAVLGWDRGPVTARDLWKHLVTHAVQDDPLAEEFAPAVDVLLAEGCLASRIRQALDCGKKETMAPVYQRLAVCLATGQMFRAGD